jgi:cell division protein FtsZ
MRVSVVATGIDANSVELKNTDDTENKTEVTKINTINQEPKSTDSVEPYLFKDLEKPMKSDQENDAVLGSISAESVEPAQLNEQSLRADDSQIEVINASNFESSSNQNEDGVAPLEEAKSERKRFGINSLISRMTNNNEDYLNKPEDSEKTNHVRDSDFEDEDRVEIPAFLRRQAN